MCLVVVLPTKNKLNVRLRMFTTTNTNLTHISAIRHCSNGYQTNRFPKIIYKKSRLSIILSWWLIHCINIYTLSVFGMTHWCIQRDDVHTHHGKLRVIYPFLAVENWLIGKTSKMLLYPVFVFFQFWHMC